MEICSRDTINEVMVDVCQLSGETLCSFELAETATAGDLRALLVDAGIPNANRARLLVGSRTCHSQDALFDGGGDLPRSFVVHMTPCDVRTDGLYRLSSKTSTGGGYQGANHWLRCAACGYQFYIGEFGNEPGYEASCPQCNAIVQGDDYFRFYEEGCAVARVTAGNEVENALKLIDAGDVSVDKGNYEIDGSKIFIVVSQSTIETVKIYEGDVNIDGGDVLLLQDRSNSYKYEFVPSDGAVEAAAMPKQVV